MLLGLWWKHPCPKVIDILLYLFLELLNLFTFIWTHMAFIFVPSVWLDPYTQGEMEAETGVMQPQPRNAKDCRQTPEARKIRQDSSLVPFRGSLALPTPWFWTFSLQTCNSVIFWCYKSCSLWHFVMAAPGAYYNHIEQRSTICWKVHPFPY